MPSGCALYYFRERLLAAGFSAVDAASTEGGPDCTQSAKQLSSLGVRCPTVDAELWGKSWRYLDRATSQTT